MSPTQRTLKALRDRGLESAIVEKYNAFVGKHGIRQDLFGIIDVISLGPQGVIGVQSTGEAFSEHLKHMTRARAKQCIKWLRTPGTSLELWGWRKVKIKLKGGGYSKKYKYEPRVHVFKLEDFGIEDDPLFE